MPAKRSVCWPRRRASRCQPSGHGWLTPTRRLRVLMAPALDCVRDPGTGSSELRLWSMIACRCHRRTECTDAINAVTHLLRDAQIDQLLGKLFGQRAKSALAQQRHSRALGIGKGHPVQIYRHLRFSTIKNRNAPRVPRPRSNLATRVLVPALAFPQCKMTKIALGLKQMGEKQRLHGL